MFAWRQSVFGIRATKSSAFYLFSVIPVSTFRLSIRLSTLYMHSRVCTYKSSVSFYKGEALIIYLFVKLLKTIKESGIYLTSFITVFVKRYLASNRSSVQLKKIKSIITRMRRAVLNTSNTRLYTIFPTIFTPVPRTFLFRVNAILERAHFYTSQTTS